MTSRCSNRNRSAALTLAVACLTLLASNDGPAATQQRNSTLFPQPDSQGGWRTAHTPEDVRRVAGMDRARLDEASEFIKGTSKNGGLLVVRRGWLVYEQYFGLGHREATPNLASCGKSVTSIAVGILLAERPDLFPDRLEQKVFTPAYLPSDAFPLTDPRKAGIKLGQLLAMTACLRGNNPVYVHGKASTIDPAGPDGWQAGVDAWRSAGRTRSKARPGQRLPRSGASRAGDTRMRPRPSISPE